MKSFHLRALFPQKSTQTLRGSNRYLTRSRLQVKVYTAQIYCLFHVVVQGPAGSFRCPSTFLYNVRLRSYWASNLHNFRILAYFPHTKPVKRTFRGDQPTGQGLHRRMITIFPCGSRRSKGCLPTADLSCDF